MWFLFINFILIIFFTNNSYSQKIYKNAEECILDKISLSKNTEATLAIIDACKKLYPTSSKTGDGLQSLEKKKMEQDIKTLSEIMELLKSELNKLSK